MVRTLERSRETSVTYGGRWGLDRFLGQIAVLLNEVYLITDYLGYIVILLKSLELNFLSKYSRVYSTKSRTSYVCGIIDPRFMPQISRMRAVVCAEMCVSTVWVGAMPVLVWLLHSCNHETVRFVSFAVKFVTQNEEDYVDVILLYVKCDKHDYTSLSDYSSTKSLVQLFTTRNLILLRFINIACVVLCLFVRQKRLNSATLI
jgi:hypothetical protein